MKPLELLQRLASEVRAVDEEEDATRVGVLDEAVGDVGSRERLPGAGRHLDEGTRAVRGERHFEIADRGDLRRPEVLRLEQREGAEAVAERGRGWMRCDVGEPARERLRPVEGKHVTARRIRVERVREARLRSGRLVREGERALDCGRDLVREAVDVLRALPLDAGERLALLLRLDDAGGGAVHEQEVVGASVRRPEDELADGHAARGGEVHRARILHRPTRGREHAIDLDPRSRLGSQVRELVRHGRIFAIAL